MILDYINGDLSGLWLKVQIVFMAWGMILLAIFIDLHYGTRKSKAAGEYIHSEGLRRTVTKISQSFTMMVFMLIFDVLNPIGLIWTPGKAIPLFTIIAAIGLVWIEFRSVREKADQKFRRKTSRAASDIVGVLVKDEKLVEIIKDTFKDDTDEEESI